MRIVPPSDHLLAHDAVDFGNLATGQHHAPAAPEVILADPARPLLGPPLRKRSQHGRGSTSLPSILEVFKNAAEFRSIHRP